MKFFQVLLLGYENDSHEGQIRSGLSRGVVPAQAFINLEKIAMIKYFLHANNGQNNINSGYWLRRSPPRSRDMKKCINVHLLGMRIMQYVAD